VKLITGKSFFMFALPVAAATLMTMGGLQSTSAAAAAPVAAQQLDQQRGERLLNASCADCHDLRPIETEAKDREGWNETVQNMLQRGATVADADIPVLVDYLAEHFGPLPDGRGKEIVLNICTQCHDLKRIRLGHRSAEEWEETLNSMLNEGAPLSDADYPIVHNYLARNFGQ